MQDRGVAAQCNVSDDASLAAALDVLDTTLGTDLGNMKGDYVCGQYTLADAMWAGVCQCATNAGKGNAISSRSRVNTWFSEGTLPDLSKSISGPLLQAFNGCVKADWSKATIIVYKRIGEVAIIVDDVKGATVIGDLPEGVECHFSSFPKT